MVCDWGYKLSPILGIWASAQQSAFVSTGSYESISTVTVGSGGSSSVSFTSIPATYKHLQIRTLARASESAPDSVGYMRFNSDSSSNYTTHGMRGNGTNVAASGEISLSSIVPLRISGGTSGANIFGVAVIDILDYANTNKYKTTRSLTGHDENGANGVVTFTSGLWLSTSAITSITFTTDVVYAQYTQFALYGIKGA